MVSAAAEGTLSVSAATMRGSSPAGVSSAARPVTRLGSVRLARRGSGPYRVVRPRRFVTDADNGSTFNKIVRPSCATTASVRGISRARARYFYLGGTVAVAAVAVVTAVVVSAVVVHSAAAGVVVSGVVAVARVVAAVAGVTTLGMVIVERK